MILDSIASERLCLTLLHSLWQIALLALAAWAIGLFLGRRRDNVSYAVHSIALVLGMVAVPITHAFLAHAGASLPADSSPAVTIVADAPANLATDVAPLAPDVSQRVEAGSPSFVVVAPAHASAIAAPTRFVWQSVMPWLAGAYIVGVLFMLTRLAWSAFLLERLRAAARPIVEGPALKSLSDICGRWSMKAIPLLAHAEEIAVPKVVGLLKPTILLPTSAITGLPIDDLELILAHELAHIRRHDLWMNVLQRLSESVLFFNPGMWWLSRRVSTLREYCCDDRACALIPESPDPELRYAEALLHAIELQRTDSSEQIAALAATGRSPSELRRRVARLLGEQIGESIRLSRGGVAVMLAGALLLLIPPTVPDSSAADKPDNTAETRQDTDANRIVAEARARTFGLQKVPRVSFSQVYRQAKVPGMQTYGDCNLDSLWKARGSQIADGEFERNRHETKLAWDDGRLLIESFNRFRPNDSWRQTHYWDGEQGWLGELSQTKGVTRKNVYRYSAIDKLNANTMPFYYPHWAAAGDRLPWPGPTLLLEENAATPSLTDYQLANTETIDGVICDVYDGPGRHEKIWIERRSGLVKAASRHYVNQVDEAKFLELIRVASGQEDFDMKNYQEWYKGLSAQELDEFSVKWSAMSWEDAEPGSLSVFSDYREIAPGVKWPHMVERVVVHGRGQAYNYSLARIIVKHQSEFKIDKLAENAFPKPGDDVTDRRKGRTEFQYKWSAELDETAINEMRDKKLSKVLAKEREIQRINATPINSVADAIRILTEGPKVEPTEIWARAIKHLADHPEQSLPALIEALDGEDRDHPISKLAFALRALGDARAVPALIRAFPRTLKPGRSDYGLILGGDKALCEFMQQHDGNGKPRPASDHFDYGRAFREVVFSLRRLTGKQFNEMELNWISLKGTAQQQRIARSQFQRVAQKWAVWWEKEWEQFVRDPSYSKVGLAVAAEPALLIIGGRKPPSGPDVKLNGAGWGGTIQSVNDTGEACFVDLDTRREAGWPDELAPLGKTRLDSPELLEWARREGFDVVGISHTPEGEKKPLYCLMPLDLEAWKITEDEHRELGDAVLGKQPYPLTRPVELLIPRRNVAKPRDPKHSGDSFLFVTREGTAGVLRLTAQVVSGKDNLAYYNWEDALFEDSGYHRGVKYVLKTMSAPGS